MNLTKTLLPFALLPALTAAAAAQDGPMTIPGETIATFDAPEANQGVGVDANYFYPVNNRTIGKYDKTTGERVAVWEGPAGGPIKHLDSAVIVDGLLYAAHSNYPEWPMTSSVEIWDAETMEHVGTHSFGIERGSLTWLDFHDGSWWGTFANYNRVFDGEQTVYGNKYNTQVVRFADDWQVAESWVIPTIVLEEFEDMSNSGGSWGPDGRLWLSGHDPAKFYVMELPEMGSELVWVATVEADIQGQGIAWDRSTPDVIYGIVRPDRRVTVTRVDLSMTGSISP